MKSVDRKILIVSYHFPPDAEVGGIRAAKFAKYLPEFGWKPYVLTVKDEYFKVRDYGRLKEVEGVTIMRTSMWPTVLGAALKIRRLILRPFRSEGSKKGSAPSGHSPSGPGKPGVARRSNLIRILDSIFELPDKWVGWTIPAVWAGYRLIRKERIPVIWTTSPVPTAALVGFILAKLTGARLVTDLRDVWFLHEGKPAGARTKLSDAIDRWLERKITYRSSKVICVTELHTGYLKERFRDLTANRFVTIFNGFDGADFNVEDSFPEGNNRFVLSYLGTFYGRRTPNEFLQAVGQLVREQVIPKEKVEIRFIGDVREADGRPVEELVAENALEDCVWIQDKIPHRESIAEMKKAVVLLLFAPQQFLMIPAKAFEYLWAKREILCFAEDGATADLIRGTGGGVVVNPRNVDEIKQAVKKFYLSWKLGEKPVYKCDISVFDRRELTRQLSELLVDVVAH